MPDFSGPIVSAPLIPQQSSVTLQQVAIPHVNPNISFVDSGANGNTALTAGEIRDALLGNGGTVDYFNKGKASAYGTSVPYSEAARYNDPNLGYSPFRDNEDLYAKNQGVFGSIGAGLGRLLLTSGTKLGTGLGYLGGLVTSAFDPAGRSRYGDGVSAWLANAGDNAFSAQFNKWEDDVKNTLFPIYQEASDRDKGFFNRAATDLNFWTDDATDGAAFMISALAPGFALSKVNAGTKLLTGLAKFMGYSDEALDAARVAELFGGSIKTGATEASTNLQYVPKVLKIMGNARAARSVDVGIQTIVSTASEAMFEANETKKNIYDKLVQNGIPVEEAAQRAAEGARDTYLMNLAALSFSNLWEANLIFKKLPSAANEALDTATREGLTGATTIARRGMTHNLAKTLGEGILAEGLWEENVQLGIQRINELAYSPETIQQIRTGERQPYTFSEKLQAVASQTAKQTVDAIMGNDPEAAMNIGMGGLIGAIAGGAGRIRENINNEKYRQNVESALNSYGAAFQSLKNVYNADGTINEEALLKVAASQGNVLELMDLVDLAEENKNLVLRDIYENELFAQFAHAHFQNGLGDLLQEKLSNVGNLKADDLQSLGFDPQNSEGAAAKVQELKVKASKLQGLYDNIQANVIGTDPKLTEFRKTELFRLGSRSMTLNEQAQRIGNELDAINLLSGENPAVTEINQRVAKLKSAQSFLDAMQTNEALQEGTATDWISAAENDVQQAQKDIDEFKENNKAILDRAKQDEDGFYSSDRAVEDVFARANRKKAMMKLAEIELSKNSVDERFNRIANPVTGNKFTKEYYDSIIKTKNPAPTLTKLKLNKTTQQQYETYESGRLRRQRIQSSLNDIEREFRSDLLNSNLDNADLDSIMSLIDQARDNNVSYTQEDKAKISQALSNQIDEEISRREGNLNRMTDRFNQLSKILPEDMLLEEEDEYGYLSNTIPQAQQEVNDLQALKNRANEILVYEPVEKTENLFRREIADEYLIEPNKIINDINQSSEGYDSASDLANVDTQIAQLENLRDIFASRIEVKSSDEFKGFMDNISDLLEQLKEARVEINRRVADRALADGRALNNHINLTGQSVGIDTTTEAVLPIYPIVSSILNSVFQDEFNNLTTSLTSAKEQNDPKKILYNLEGIQLLLQRAIHENAEIRKNFETQLTQLQGKLLADFISQPGLSDVKITLSDNKIADVYSKNPQNVFRLIINTLANTNDKESKDSPIYKYLQNFNLTEFLNNTRISERDDPRLSKEDLIALIKSHMDYLSTTNLQSAIESDLILTEEVENELSVINKSIAEQAKQEPNPNILVQTPSNEQLISLRELTRFLFTQTKNIPFANWAYLKGAAGSGKSQIISKWLLKLAKISTKDTFVIGHTISSSANINEILGKEGIAPQAKELIEALDSNEPMKLIIIDEIGGFDGNTIIQIQEAVDKYNKANNVSVKIIALGDPNQLTVDSNGNLNSSPAIETVRYTGSDMFKGQLNNITVISPLTIRYRSDVSQVTNFADKFINQSKDLSSEEMVVMSNNPTLSNSKLIDQNLLGVIGSKDFKGTLNKILPVLTSKQDGRSRAIITSPSKVQDYIKLLQDNNIPLTDVEVLSYIDAQGRTIDEVYVDIPNSITEFKDNIIYNKAMYVATSRATDFVLVSNYNTQNELDNNIIVDVENKQASIKESANNFKNDRTQELDILNKVSPLNQEEKVTGTQTEESKPESTKKTTDQTDIEESEDNEEENPAPETKVEEEVKYDVINDQVYNDFIDKGVVSSDILDSIADKIIANIPLSTRETEIFDNKTGDINDIVAAKKSAQIPQNLKNRVDEHPVHNLRFPTSEAATNIIMLEGAVSPSYVSDSALASMTKKGVIPELRNKATAVGDKVLYIPVANGEDTFFVLLTPLKDANNNSIAGKYRQIGVIGDQELEDMKNDSNLIGLYNKLSSYKSNPDNKAMQVSLDKNELTLSNPISIAEGSVANIEYINFTYNDSPTKFNLHDIVTKFVQGLYGTAIDVAKKVAQVKKNAKIIIYKTSDKMPSENMKPGIPYLILSNLGDGIAKSKQLYIELSGRRLNSKDHQDYIAPIKEFISVIKKLNNLIGDGDFVYGNAVFENAIIKIARRNKTGDFDVAGRTLNITKEVLDLARKADALHIKPKGGELSVGSKVKYNDTELSFTSVGIRRNDSKSGEFKKGDKYSYKSAGTVAEIQRGVDENTGEETVKAVKVRYFDINKEGATRENVTDWIPVSELNNTQTESGKAQLALNNLWRGNESTVRGTTSHYFEGQQTINRNGEAVTKEIFQYPSILRSDSTNSGYNENALEQLEATVNFDDIGNHVASDYIGQLRVPVPRSTTNVNFTNTQENSINSDKITQKYLETKFSSVSPTKISVVLDSEEKSPSQQVESKKSSKPTKKIIAPRARRLSGTAYSSDQLGRDYSQEDAKKFIASKLPGLSPKEIDERVRFVNEVEMMRITGGLPAWGYFVDNLIYLQQDNNNKVKENAVRHEVAHYIFNNYLSEKERQRFISDLKKDRPFMNFMTNDEVLEYVDEFIAEGYQNYQSKKGIGSFVKSILRKIANFLGFATPFIRNLNDFFGAIDDGIFITPSNEQLLVNRPLLSVKEHFGGKVTNYLRAKELFSTVINEYTNPSDEISQDEDGNLENVPLTREEAVSKALQYFQDRVTEFNETDDKLSIDPLDLEDYEVSIDLIKTDKKGRYFVFEELVKDFYPNFRFIKIPGTNMYQGLETNKAFDYNYESDEDYVENVDNPIPQEDGDDIVRANEGWLDDQDTINPLKKASQAVKDFISTMSVKSGDDIEAIRPGYVFYKLLQNLSGIDVNDLPVGNEVRAEIQQIKDNFIYNGMRDIEDESNRDWVIFQKISDMLEKSNTSVDSEGNRLPKDSYFQWRGDNQKGYYEFITANGKSISSLTKGNKKPTDEFFKDVHNATRLPYSTIKALYEQKESAESINSIYQVINSMRQKSPMFGEYEWNWGKNKKQILKRIYGAFKDESSLAAAKAFVSNNLSNKYDRLAKYTDKLANRKNEKNKVNLAKTIMADLGITPNISSIYVGEDTARNLLNNFDAIAKLSQIIGTQIGINPETNIPVIYGKQEFVSDLKGYITKIAKVVNSRKTEVGRSSSYIGGDGKPRWFFMNSTQAFDTFRKIIEQRPLRGFLTNPTSIFKYNIFNPNTETPVSSIYSLRDHDSIGEVDSLFDPVLYRRELTRDFMDRNFMYGFVNFIGDSTTQGMTYLQQFYTISNKPNMLAAQVDVLSHDKIKDAIKQAILQEANRSPKGVANYDSNISNGITYMVGMDKALTPEESQDEKVVNRAVQQVYKALQDRSKEAFLKYVSLNPVLDKNFSSVRGTLVNTEFVEPSLASEADNLREIKGNNRYDKLETEEEKADFENAVYPIFDLFYKNYFINSIFLNQIAAGDQAQYKDEYDEIKRMSMAFAIGYRGRVNDQTGLRRSFNVAVAKDFKDTIGSDTFIGKTFSKLLGASYELTDAQGFMTPERATNIRRGFSREANLGATMKPVYFGIDQDGVSRGIKYSTIELTNELVNTFPELADLRYQMTFGKGQYANDQDVRDLYNGHITNSLSSQDLVKYENLVNQEILADNHVDEMVFESAFKVGKPLQSSDWKRDGLINAASIVKLTNDNYRHQLNPRHDSDAKTSNPSQLTYQINTNGKNFARLRKVLSLNSLLHNSGLQSVMDKLFPNGDIDNAARRTVRRTIAEPLAKVPGNERYAEFIQDPEISLNLPNITNKLQQSFLAYISKRTIEIKHKGSKLVLQSSFGTQAREILRAGEQTEPRLVFVDKNGVLSHDEGFDEKSVVTYYMEVYLPNIYKNQNLRIGSDVWITDPVYSNLMGFRIPSTELHSAVPLKVKGFYPSEYGDNVIIAPKELVVLHGSDFDIDSLYTINKFVAQKDIVSPEGLQVAYKGDAVGYRYTSDKGTIKIDTKANQSFPELLSSEIDKARRYVRGFAPTNNIDIWKDYLSDLETLLPQATSNEILDTFMETISAEENIQDMMSPISMAVFNDITDENSVFNIFANLLSEKETGKKLPAIPERHQFSSDEQYNRELKSWTSNAMKYIRPSRNLNLVDDEVEMHQDNFRASMGTGIAANAFKIISYIFMGTTNMKTNTQLTESEQPLPKLKQDYHIEIDGVTYDKFNRYVIKNGKLQNSGDTRTTTFQIIDSIINAAIDHVKEQILNVVNISNKTINGYISMIAMGVDPKTTSLFIAQPSLRELSNRASDRRAGATVMAEMRQELLKSFASADYVNKYNEIEQDEELKPRDRDKQLRKLANTYFNSVVKATDYDNIKITTEALENSFKLDYDPSKMTKNQLLFQMKVLSEFMTKVDYIGDYLAKGSRALNSIRQIPSEFSQMENIKQLYEKFFDVEAAMNNADPNRVEDIEVEIPSKFPFDNVDLSTVLNISSSLNVLDEVMTATGKVFLREGNTLVNFSDHINTFMLDEGLEDFDQNKESEDEQEYVRQNDKGFLDWNSARSQQKIRQNFVEYLMTGINFELPSGKTIIMSVDDEIPLEYEYTKKVRSDEGIERIELTGTTNGVTAWTKRFIELGRETEFNGKKVRLKSIKKLIEQYGFNSETANAFLANLSIKYTSGPSKTPYLSFAMGSSLDNVEKVDFENEFEKLKNLSIYETLDGEDIDPEVLGEGQYNELQYNLLKYDILANGLSFGSYSYSQVMSIPIFRQVSKQLDEMMFGLLDEKNPKFEISRIRDHFALQMALMNVNKVKSINPIIETKDNNPVYGYDETYDTYYDMIVKNYKGRGVRNSDVPTFVKRGQTLYVKVTNPNKESPHVYYQRVERFNETKSFSFNSDILYNDNGYKLDNYFSASKLAISALEIKKSGDRFVVQINPKFEPKVTLAKAEDIVMIHSPSDYSRMNSEEFKVIRATKGFLNGKEVVNLVLERQSSEDIKSDFLKFSIDQVAKANKEIRDAQDKLNKDCKGN